MYGRGVASEARYVTPVIDMGRPVTLGRVFFAGGKGRRLPGRWIASTLDESDAPRWEPGELVDEPDVDAEVKVRFRIGSDDDPLGYYTWTDQGEFTEVDFDDWLALKRRSHSDSKAFVGWQGPIIDDAENWIPWSGPATESGTRLDLPSGRYVQVQVAMLSGQPTDMAWLDSLSFEILPLLARHLVGEVGLASEPLSTLPVQLDVGAPTELTYAMGAKVDRDQDPGFDALHIGTPSPPEFLDLRMGDGLELVEPDSVRASADGLTVYLPRRVEADEEVQVGMRLALYTVFTRVRGQVFNRANAEVRQRVQEGDATPTISTNRLTVTASGRRMDEVIDGLEVTPAVVTPNADGRNDVAQVGFNLFGVSDANVEIAIYSMSGIPVFKLERSVGSGRHRSRWDGRTADGRLVAPGLYLAQVRVKTGRGAFQRTVSFPLAY